jgi:ankyrin repeat protein
MKSNLVFSRPLLCLLVSCGKSPQKQLLERKIEFNKDAFVACAEKGDTIAIELFLKAKMDVNSKNKEGWTPLSQACLKGQTAVVQLLLDHGASPNEKDDALSPRAMSSLWL